MQTVIVSVILVAVIGAAAGYIFHAKKKGRKCIGCPDSGHCAGCCENCHTNYK